MIPKIIHYCWFGNKPLSNLEQDCIKSWKKILPTYTIKLWNEQNFDYKAYKFSAKAFRLRKFAFVSDVCRLHALYVDGGIYLDTDMFVLRDFSNLLVQEFFLGEEKEGLISAGIIGSTKNNPLLLELLDRYRQLSFDYEKPMDIPTILTSYLTREKATIYPKKYFYPLPFGQRGMDYKPFVQPETYTVHLWNHSWKNEWDYLHDKNFGRAWSEFIGHLFSRPLTRKKVSFPLQFCKYYLAHLFPGIYGQVKSMDKD